MPDIINIKAMKRNVLDITILFCDETTKQIEMMFEDKNRPYKVEYVDKINEECKTLVGIPIRFSPDRPTQTARYITRTPLFGADFNESISDRTLQEYSGSIVFDCSSEFESVITTISLSSIRDIHDINKDYPTTFIINGEEFNPLNFTLMNELNLDISTITNNKPSTVEFFGATVYPDSLHLIRPKMINPDCISLLLNRIDDDATDFMISLTLYVTNENGKGSLHKLCIPTHIDKPVATVTIDPSIMTLTELNKTSYYSLKCLNTVGENVTDMSTLEIKKEDGKSHILATSLESSIDGSSTSHLSITPYSYGKEIVTLVQKGTGIEFYFKFNIVEKSSIPVIATIELDPVVQTMYTGTEYRYNLILKDSAGLDITNKCIIELEYIQSSTDTSTSTSLVTTTNLDGDTVYELIVFATEPTVDNIAIKQLLIDDNKFPMEFTVITKEDN